MGWQVTWKESRAAFGGMPGSYQHWDPEGCWAEAEVSKLAELCLASVPSGENWVHKRLGNECHYVHV